MGKMVSFWSPVSRTGRTTLLYMLSLKLQTMLADGVRVLICCFNRQSGNLLDLFRVGRNEPGYEDLLNLRHYPGGAGFKADSLLARQGLLYFCGSRHAGGMSESHKLEIHRELLEDLRREFDLVLVDTVSGKNHALTNLVLALCDGVVNVIEQDKGMLDLHPFKTSKDLLYAVNRYEEVYPGIHELSRLYGISGMFPLPDCRELREMKNKARLDLYFQHDSGYNRAVGEIAGFMARSLELPLSAEKASNTRKVRKGVLRGLLGGSG